ncbi:MAG TPA: hypothetical protein VMT45_03220 [Thermoanaerobaculaceae bacterium]|nr:hypothetical protein [Thermoanaerobaculaceae bacterium]
MSEAPRSSALGDGPHGVLLGRTQELGVLTGALVAGGSALILGGKGMGKSALLAAAHRAAIARGLSTGLAAASERSDITLAGLIDSLDAGGTVKAARVRALQARLRRWCFEHPCAIFLDDGDRASGEVLRTVRRIVFETSASVVVAARVGPADPPDRLRRAAYPGSREIRLAPLKPRFARALARIHLGGDPKHENAIIRQSGGVPAAIVEMARRHRDRQYSFQGQISWTLLIADLRMENRI